jgi:PhnB protein
MPAQNVSAIPAGYHSVTSFLIVRNGTRAIEFYQQAFGARETGRMNGPGGTISHAELKIGDSVVMLADEIPGTDLRSPQSLGGSAVGILLYVDNVEEMFDRAVKAGATIDAPVAEMFWGDRFGKLKDPFGHSWTIATHIEDLGPDEIRKRAQSAMADVYSNG